MDPVEIDEHLQNRSLNSLIMFTGLDVSNSAEHALIYRCFCESNNRERSASIHYRMLTADNELFRRLGTTIGVGGDRSRSVTQSPPLATSPIMKSGRGVLKRSWPLKYLVNRPALVVCFIDLDWSHPSWTEKKTECESKINSLR